LEEIQRMETEKGEREREREREMSDQLDAWLSVNTMCLHPFTK
jgi:hypothetical protein